MTRPSDLRGLSRRELIARGTAFGGAFVIGEGFLAHAKAGVALVTQSLQPATFVTLVQVARDTYPHDRIPDEAYMRAVKGHDEQAATDDAHKALIEGGIATLDTLAQAKGASGYAGLGWEDDRVALLRQIEDSAFFQTVRGGLVVSLYNQKEVWPHFGYEGASYEHGGYIDRGFDDISWL